MKSKLFLLFFVIVLFPVEILAQRVLTNEELKENDYSYQHPKKKFKFAKNKYIARLKTLTPFPIDTNAVYTSSSFNSNIKDTTYYFFRFFGTGEVFISYEYRNMPTEKECNDLTYGNWGMYNFKKGNLITESRVLHDFVAFHYNYAKIDKNNNLRFYKRKLGKWGGSKMVINYTLTKKQVKLTNFTINWK
jgi:hypothetical protein